MKGKKPKHAKRRTRPVKGFVKPDASLHQRVTIKPRTTQVNPNRHQGR